MPDTPDTPVRANADPVIAMHDPCDGGPVLTARAHLSATLSADLGTVEGLSVGDGLTLEVARHDEPTIRFDLSTDELESWIAALATAHHWLTRHQSAGEPA